MEGNIVLQRFRKLHWFAMLIGALTIVLPLVFWSKIPEQIPMHYNGAGEIDRWSDKSSIILIMFCIVLLMGLMSIVVYFVKSNLQSPNSKEYEKTEMAVVYPVVILMNLVIQVMFAYIMLCVVTGKSLGGWFAPVFLTLTFAPLLYFFVKRPKRPTKIYASMENKEEGITYRSKVDWWLGLILGGSMLWLAYLAVEPIVKTGKVKWIVVISAIVTIGILAPLFTMEYVLYSDHLMISCGIYGKFRIGYENIISVKKTNNPLSSAALSLRRLQIDYVEDGTHGMVLISPVRRNEFIELLRERCGKEIA